jgi:hypothetical protein
MKTPLMWVAQAASQETLTPLVYPLRTLQVSSPEEWV